MSVRNYAPELLEIFKIGSQKPFHFDCKTEKKALALRARLYYLRLEMRKENFWLLPVAEAVILKVNGSILMACPPDSDILEDLKRALEKQKGELENDRLSKKK